jgi:hypothetical protein
VFKNRKLSNHSPKGIDNRFFLFALTFLKLKHIILLFLVVVVVDIIITNKEEEEKQEHNFLVHVYNASRELSATYNNTIFLPFAMKRVL